MSEERFSLMILLRSLSDEGFRSVKELVSANQQLFVSQKHNYMASGLLSALCEPRVLLRLTRTDFANVLGSMFRDNQLDPENFERYALDLMRLCLFENREMYKNADTLKYADHFIAVQIPALKALIKEPEKHKEIVLQLADIFKTATCIYRYREDDHFEFSTDRRIFKVVKDELLNSYRKHWNKYDAEQGKIKEGKELLDFIFHDEYTRYALILTFILCEIVTDQDGLMRKVAMNHAK